METGMERSGEKDTERSGMESRILITKGILYSALSTP